MNKRHKNAIRKAYSDYVSIYNDLVNLRHYDDGSIQMYNNIVKLEAEVEKAQLALNALITTEEHMHFLKELIAEGTKT